jgi:hypothetical protein
LPPSGPPDIPAGARRNRVGAALDRDPDAGPRRGDRHCAGDRCREGASDGTGSPARRRRQLQRRHRGIAARAGAEVIERFDPDRRGKGYALDFGVRHLSTRPPEIVVIVDADCIVEGDAIDRLARQSQRPAFPRRPCT